MTEDIFNELFDSFELQQEALGYPELTHDQSSIIGHFVHFLVSCDLLKIENIKTEEEANED